MRAGSNCYTVSPEAVIAGRYKFLEEVQPGVLMVEARDGSRRTLWKMENPRIEAELELLTQWVTPSLTQILTLVWHEGAQYALTQCPRDDLAPLEGPISEAVFVEYFTRLLEALVALHERQLTHGHIGPGSMLRVGHGDWSLVGHWESPGEASAQDDLKDVGRLMHLMVTGQERLDPTLKCRPDFDLKLAALVDKAVSENPFRSAKDFLATLLRLSKSTQKKPYQPAGSAPVLLDDEQGQASGVYIPIEGLYLALGIVLTLFLVMLFSTWGGRDEPVLGQTDPSPTATLTATQETQATPTPEVEERPTPQSQPDGDPLPVVRPTRRPKPEPTKTVKIRPSYPKADTGTKPQSSPSPKRSDTPDKDDKPDSNVLKKPYKVVNKKAEFAFQVPAGWEILKQSRRDKGTLLEIRCAEPDPIKNLEISVDADTIYPSRWKNSYSLKKEQDGWAEVDLSRTDLAFVRRGRLAAVKIQHLPYSMYRYTIFEVQSESSDEVELLRKTEELLLNFETL